MTSPTAAETIAVPSERRARARGRVKASERQAVRERRIRFAGLVLAGVLSKSEAAGAYGCDLSSIYKWIDELLADGEPDTEGLRRLADRR